MKVVRVAVVVSHPIQHFCPQYSSWANVDGIELKIFFASRHGLDAYEDKNFGRTVQWDHLVLDFPHEFLPGAAERSVGAGVDCHDLGDRLEEFAPDVVVVYGYTQPLQRRAIRWAKLETKSLVMIADSELRAHRSWVKRMAKAIVLPFILRKIDLFLSVGDANESYYRHYGVADRKLIRSFFPIDIKAFDALDPSRTQVRASLRAELGIPDGHTVLLMVGKLVPWKRQEDIIEFSNRIQGARHDVTVIIAGTGPDEGRLRKKAKKEGAGGILFAGFVPPSKLVEYYLAADIYVHCSEVEPHSLAISEAIYSALPVILSDRCGSYGPSDDVRPGLNGFVYPCGRVDTMHSALMAIIDNPEMKESMGLESRAIAVGNQALAHGKALTQALKVIYLEGGH